MSDNEQPRLVLSVAEPEPEPEPEAPSVADDKAAGSPSKTVLPFAAAVDAEDPDSALHVFDKVAQQDDTRDLQVLRQSGVPAILQGMRRYPNASRVQLLGTRALLQVCTEDPSTRRHLLTRQHVEALTANLLQFQTNVQLADLTVCTMSLVGASGEAGLELLESVDAFNILLALMDHHLSEGPLQEHISWILCVALSPNGRRLADTMDLDRILHLLQRSLRKHMGDGNIVESELRVLAALQDQLQEKYKPSFVFDQQTSSPDALLVHCQRNTELKLQDGSLGAQYLILTMQKHLVNDELARCGLQIIRELSSQCRNCRRKLIYCPCSTQLCELNMHVVTLSALQFHEQHSGIVHQGLMVLHTLVSGSTERKDMLLKAECIPAFARLLSRHELEVTVVEPLLLCLLSLSVDKAHRDQLMHNDTLLRGLLKCIEQHIGSPVVEASISRPSFSRLTQRRHFFLI
ncbi:uncharacterized protein MONBRDRAFT_25333 [Monosiga brevicollis MX1]|uniref:Uncharacterized protein n=1 Tax=Monosiga brevicollis TaxID=81824 RepID=A9UZ40_MONBE|nr:uncharacterized protein MONBRDRAFT_25333 [Monosiga brevicollis MX1]EDQ89566.1 predicted protein [Monosiga brevicollis MX1]|eukprot:XP_001745595.1 hypothetical protein [Monosiga brevicollis MX1]